MSDLDRLRRKAEEVWVEYMRLEEEIEKIEALEAKKFTEEDSPKGETVPGVNFKIAA